MEGRKMNKLQANALLELIADLYRIIDSPEEVPAMAPPESEHVKNEKI